MVIGNGGVVNAEATNDLVTFSNTLTINSGGTLYIGGNNTVTELNLSGTTNNDGLIHLTSYTNPSDVTLDAASGTLNNNLGGTVQASAGAGGVRAIRGAFNNVGTFTVDHDASASNGTLTNTGTITIAASKTLTINSTLIMGTSSIFSGTGTLFINDGATLRFDVNQTIGTGMSVLLGTTGGGGATFDQTGGSAATISGVLNLKNGNVNLPLTVAAGGQVTAQATNNLVNINNTMAISASGLFELTGNNIVTEVNVNAALTSAGNIRLTSYTNPSDITLDASAGSITISSTGLLDIAAGVGGARTVKGGMSVAGIADTVTNATFNIGTANIEVVSGGTFNVQSGATAILTGTTGQLRIMSGGQLTVNGTLNLNGRDLVNGGTISGFANINFGGGAYVLTQTQNLSAFTVTNGLILAFGAGSGATGTGSMTVSDGGTMRMDANASFASGLAINFGTTAGAGATLTGGGVLTIGGIFNANKGTVSAPVIVSAGGTLNTANSNDVVTISGAVTVNTGAFFTVEDTTDNEVSTELNVTGTITNAGTVTLNANGGNGAGGDNVTLDLSGGGSLVNAGTLALTGINANSVIVTGAVSNSGTINVNQSSTYQGGTLTNTGAIVVASSTTLAIASGATLASGTGGAYSGAGSLLIADGGTFRFDSNGTIAASHTVNFGAGGAGATWSNTGGAVSTVAGTVNLISGTVSLPLTVSTGGLVKTANINGLVTIASAVTVDSGANFTVEDTTDNEVSTELNVTGTITNAGTVTLNANGGNGAGGDNVTLDLSGGGSLVNAGR